MRSGIRAGLFLSMLAGAASMAGEAARPPAESAVIERIRDAYIFLGGGSGVVISSDGYALTNFHVAGLGPNVLTVRRTNGQAVKACVVGCDPEGDLTLLKLQAEAPLPHADLRPSSEVRTGEECYAVGDPFSLGTQNADPTISKGIVCSPRVFMGNGYYDVVLTDAPINPGNSGGPLFDAEGRLIGINGRIQSRFGTRFNTGAGYAISSDAIRTLLPRMMACQGGYLAHVGLDGAEVTVPHPARPDAYPPDELVVAAVKEGSPSESAGLRKGDRILSVEGKELRQVPLLFARLGLLAPGEPIRVRVRRGEPAQDLDVAVPTAALEHFGWSFPMGGGGLDAGGRFAATEDKKALQVEEVWPGGPAEKAGLKPGDRIVQAVSPSGKPVPLKPEIWNQGLRIMAPRQAVSLSVERGAGPPAGETAPAEAPKPERLELALGRPSLALRYHRSLGFAVGEDGTGLRIESVEKGGLADAAGLCVGMAIREADGKAVGGRFALLEAIHGAKRKGPLRLKVVEPGAKDAREIEIPLRHY